MKLPFTSSSKTTLLSEDINPLAYEPNSVLDLRGSPTPQNHVLINPQFEDWDFWMKELGLHDDDDDDDSLVSETHLAQNISEFSAQFISPEFRVSDFPVYGSGTGPVALGSHCQNWNVGLDYVDELIRLAECFETNSLHLGQVILARLNERLSFPAGKPLHRAAFYFKEALQSLLAATSPINRVLSSAEVVQTIKAQKIFAGISPIPMFSSFTANQAVLEAIDGAMHVHVVDFDIGFGSQWASFMKEMSELHKSPAPLLRISAVVPEEYEMELNLIRENLTQFARELNIRFDMDFTPIRTFQHLSFKAINFTQGEKVAVVLSPAIFRQIGSGFLNDLPRISPTVVVHVDIEGQVGSAALSYRQAVIKGLEFYSTVMESIEAGNLLGSNGWDWIRKIETFILFPKIIEAVEGVGRQGTSAREAFAAAGLKPVVISQFTEFQAECLVRKVQVRGFHVIKRQGEMVLYWQERPVGAMSAWRY